MSMEWMLPRRDGRRSAFLDHWIESALKVANSPPHALAEVGDRAVDVVAAPENLKLAWDHLAAFGGEAAGPNGKSFRDFTRVKAWDEIQRLHLRIMSGAYRHGKVRHQPIAKQPGPGSRQLSIPDVQDRVVGRAEVQVLEPLFRAHFDERSFCRHGRGPWDALATAQLLAKREDRWIWIADDIHGAFDNVDLKLLIDVIHSSIPSGRLRDLIRRSVNDRHQRGLYQGAPLSPLLMNLFLDRFVDREWRRRHPDVPLLRYMDDLLVLCRDSDDPEQLHRDLSELVQAAGLQLKHGFASAVHNLATEEVEWLGYRIGEGRDGMVVRLPFIGDSDAAKNWRACLRARFKELHRKLDSPEAAMQMVRGIINWAGPALPWTDTRDAYRILHSAARAAAFEEMDSYSATLEKWQKAHEVWNRNLDLIAANANDDAFQHPKHDRNTWGPNQAPWEQPNLLAG